MADHCFQHCETEPTVFENSGQWVLKALYKAEESSPKPERLLTTSSKPVLARWPKELQTYRSKTAAKHTVPILQKFLNGDKEITAAFLKGHIEDLAVLSSKSPRSHIPTPTNSTRTTRESGPHADMSGAVQSAPEPAACEPEKKTEEPAAADPEEGTASTTLNPTSTVKHSTDENEKKDNCRCSIQ